MQSDTLQKYSSAVAAVATTPTTPVSAAAAARTVVVAAAQPVMGQMLAPGLAADAVTDTSDEGLSVSHLLQLLYKSRQLMNSHVKLWDMDVRCVSAANNKSKLRGALELAAKTWAPEQQEASLRSPNLAKEELMTITTSIDTACLLQMRLLENKSGTTTGKHKAYFLSLGTRFIKWTAAQPPPSRLKRIIAFF
jgi:hypothetical protein